MIVSIITVDVASRYLLRNLMKTTVHQQKWRNIFALLFAIGVSELAGVVGSVVTIPAISTWYDTLTKPAVNPPAWLFGPVWTLLYFLMGIAAFLIWRKGWQNRHVKIALAVFGVQLALNTLWSIIFFGFRSPGWALIEITFLWSAILATVIVFAKISKSAAWLLAPYLLWTSFAVYLNLSLWNLN